MSAPKRPVRRHYDAPGMWISIIYRRAQSHLGRVFSDLGLCYSQLPFLMRLFYGDGQSQDALASAVSIDKGTAARAIRHLEESGFVERRRDENDGRVNLVFLTDKARDIRKPVHDLLHEWNQALFEGFDEDAREDMMEMLQRMASNAAETVRRENEKED